MTMEDFVTSANVLIRRGRRAAVVALLAAAGVMAGAQPASADLIDPPGSCRAVATWTDGDFSVDSSAANPDSVIEIPRSDHVAWTAKRADLSGDAERQVSGSVTLALPMPLGTVTIDDWSGPSTKATNSGTWDYDLPALVPAGVVVQVRGSHHENGALFCAGTARLRIAGGPLGSPLTWASLAVTALLAVALLLTGRASSPGVGRLILGAVLGLLLGWLLGLTLVLFGISTLGGPLPLVIAVLGLVGGPVWVRLSPLRRTGALTGAGSR